MIRLTLGERVYDYDESAPLSAGDLMAIREMGADPAKWAGMSAWLREDGQVAGELTDRDYLTARRVRIALQGHQPFAAAVKAVHDTLKALREGTPPGKLAGVASADLMKRVTRDADYTRWTRDFLGGA